MIHGVDRRTRLPKVGAIARIPVSGGASNKGKSVDSKKSRTAVVNGAAEDDGEMEEVDEPEDADLEQEHEPDGWIDEDAVEDDEQIDEEVVEEEEDIEEEAGSELAADATSPASGATKGESDAEDGD